MNTANNSNIDEQSASKATPLSISSPMRRIGGLKLPLLRNPMLGLVVLFGTFFMMLVIVSLIGAILGQKLGNTPALLRILTVVQDVLVFILPALIAAIVVTRLPASFLTIDVKPRLKTTLLALCILVTAMPAMEVIIQLNENIHFPESLKPIEDMLRSMENQAADAVSNLIGANTIGGLIISVLIVGLLTGVAEELFFRGALQNLFFSTNIRKHLCVWLTAIIFSFMHFQFFGFVPRVLLGAYFGYLLWWTGSVWVPILAHALNNSMAVIAEAYFVSSTDAEQVEASLESYVAIDWATAALSLLVTIFGIIILRRRTKNESKQ